MSVRQWMVAGVLALAGMGVAAAAELDAHDMTAASRNSTESSAHDNAGNGGGDLLGINRDAASSRHDGDDDTGSGGGRSNGGTAGGGEHGGRISAPTTARPATLGWQSLLPGSIQ